MYENLNKIKLINFLEKKASLLPIFIGINDISYKLKGSFYGMGYSSYYRDEYFSINAEYNKTKNIQIALVDLVSWWHGAGYNLLVPKYMSYSMLYINFSYIEIDFFLNQYTLFVSEHFNKSKFNYNNESYEHIFYLNSSWAKKQLFYYLNRKYIHIENNKNIIFYMNSRISNSVYTLTSSKIVSYYFNYKKIYIKYININLKKWLIFFFKYNENKDLFYFNVKRYNTLYTGMYYINIDGIVDEWRNLNFNFTKIQSIFNYNSIFKNRIVIKNRLNFSKIKIQISSFINNTVNINIIHSSIQCIIYNINLIKLLNLYCIKHKFYIELIKILYFKLIKILLSLFLHYKNIYLVESKFKLKSLLNEEIIIKLLDNSIIVFIFNKIFEETTLFNFNYNNIFMKKHLVNYIFYLFEQLILIFERKEKLSNVKENLFFKVKTFLFFQKLKLIFQTNKIYNLNINFIFDKLRNKIKTSYWKDLGNFIFKKKENIIISNENFIFKKKNNNFSSSSVIHLHDKKIIDKSKEEEVCLSTKLYTKYDNVINYVFFEKIKYLRLYLSDNCETKLNFLFFWSFNCLNFFSISHDIVFTENILYRFVYLMSLIKKFYNYYNFIFTNFQVLFRNCKIHLIASEIITYNWNITYLFNNIFYILRNLTMNIFAYIWKNNRQSINNFFLKTDQHIFDIFYKIKNIKYMFDLKKKSSNSLKLNKNIFNVDKEKSLYTETFEFDLKFKSKQHCINFFLKKNQINLNEKNVLIQKFKKKENELNLFCKMNYFTYISFITSLYNNIKNTNTNIVTTSIYNINYNFLKKYNLYFYNNFINNNYIFNIVNYFNLLSTKVNLINLYYRNNAIYIRLKKKLYYYYNIDKTYLGQNLIDSVPMFFKLKCNLYEKETFNLNIYLNFRKLLKNKIFFSSEKIKLIRIIKKKFQYFYKNINFFKNLYSYKNIDTINYLLNFRKVFFKKAIKVNSLITLLNKSIKVSFYKVYFFKKLINNGFKLIEKSNFDSFYNYGKWIFWNKNNFCFKNKQIFFFFFLKQKLFLFQKLLQYIFVYKSNLIKSKFTYYEFIVNYFLYLKKSKYFVKKINPFNNLEENNTCSDKWYNIVRSKLKFYYKFVNIRKWLYFNILKRVFFLEKISIDIFSKKKTLLSILKYNHRLNDQNIIYFKKKDIWVRNNKLLLYNWHFLLKKNHLNDFFLKENVNCIYNYIQRLNYDVLSKKKKVQIKWIFIFFIKYMLFKYFKFNSDKYKRLFNFYIWILNFKVNNDFNSFILLLEKCIKIFSYIFFHIKSIKLLKYNVKVYFWIKKFIVYLTLLKKNIIFPKKINLLLFKKDLKKEKALRFKLFFIKNTKTKKIKKKWYISEVFYYKLDRIRLLYIINFIQNFFLKLNYFTHYFNEKEFNFSENLSFNIRSNCFKLMCNNDNFYRKYYDIILPKNRKIKNFFYFKNKKIVWKRQYDFKKYIILYKCFNFWLKSNLISKLTKLKLDLLLKEIKKFWNINVNWKRQYSNKTKHSFSKHKRYNFNKSILINKNKKEFVLFNKLPFKFLFKRLKFLFKRYFKFLLLCFPKYFRKKYFLFKKKIVGKSKKRIKRFNLYMKTYIRKYFGFLLKGIILLKRLICCKMIIYFKKIWLEKIKFINFFKHLINLLCKIKKFDYSQIFNLNYIIYLLKYKSMILFISNLLKYKTYVYNDFIIQNKINFLFVFLKQFFVRSGNFLNFLIYVTTNIQIQRNNKIYRGSTIDQKFFFKKLNLIFFFKWRIFFLKKKLYSHNNKYCNLYNRKFFRRYVKSIYLSNNFNTIYIYINCFYLNKFLIQKWKDELYYVFFVGEMNFFKNFFKFEFNKFNLFVCNKYLLQTNKLNLLNSNSKKINQNTIIWNYFLFKII